MATPLGAAAAQQRCSSPTAAFPQPGENLPQPALAKALRTLGRNGARDFYEGEIAQSIARYMKSAGGMMTAQDLAQFRASWHAPVTASYRGCVVNTLPPTSQTWMLAQMVGALDGIDVGSMAHGSKELTRTLVDVVRCAFRDRNDKFGDPKFTGFSVDERLSKQHLDEIRRAVGAPLAEASMAAHGGDTTAFAWSTAKETASR